MLADWVHELPLRFQVLICIAWWFFSVILPIVALCAIYKPDLSYWAEEDEWLMDLLNRGITIWFILLVIFWFINPSWFAWAIPEIGC